MLKLLSLGLSENPNAILSEDGKFNLTSDGRLYLVAKFRDPEDPFGQIRVRTISQQFNTTGEPVWKVDVQALKSFVGKTMKGDIVRVDTTPYLVGDRTCTSFTGVKFHTESLEGFIRAHFKKDSGVQLATSEQTVEETVDAETGEVSPSGNPRS